MRKILSALLVTSFLGCSSTATTVKNTAIDCVKQDLGQTANQAGQSLLMDVVGVLAAGATGWEAQLATLAATFGQDAINCAVTIAEELFRQALPNAGSATVGATDEDLAGAHDRAARYLASH